jgi:hypothetical protein
VKALYINSVQELPEEVAERKRKVEALIRQHWERLSDFELGLLADPPLGVNVIRELRLNLGLNRPKTKLRKRLGGAASAQV